jgi:hypothetical protein
MADKKISALTAATTPLAGTEVLPIVQSGATVKVAISDVTAGRAVTMLSNTMVSASAVNDVDKTGGGSYGYRIKGNDQSNVRFRFENTGGQIYELVGGNPGASNSGFAVYDSTAGATRLYLGSTGDWTVNTGNLVIGTSGKGIDFSATSGSGTSELLSDYEEGTWTPTFAFAGGSTGITGTFEGSYTKVGRLVTLIAQVTLTSKGSSTGAIAITNLPFNGGNYLPSTSIEGSGSVGLYTATSGVYGMTVVLNNGDTLLIYGAILPGAAALTQLDNTNITDTTALRFSIQYFA